MINRRDLLAGLGAVVAIGLPSPVPELTDAT